MVFEMNIMASNLKGVVIFVAFLFLSCSISRGQFWDSSTGLLQSPSAEMNKSGTFMITNNFMNKHSLDSQWGYHTFGYGFNITFLKRIEIGYVCTIFDGKRHPNPSERDLMMFNQDRHFVAKVLLLQEEEFGLNWMPAVAIGISDPVTGSGGGEYIGSDITGSVGNGFFNRYYVVATKHFYTRIGRIGAHLGYQYNRRKEMPMNGPCAAIDWMPIWLSNSFVTAKVVAEYDSRTFNVGVIASIWEDHLDVMLELMSLRWVNAGIRFKFVLKS